MGDFNYKSIDWTTWSTKSDDLTNEPCQFTETLRDNFLFQHVLKPTRARIDNEPSILDLIITNEENMVQDLESGLAKTRVLLVLPNPVGKTRVLLGFTGFYWVKPGFTG